MTIDSIGVDLENHLNLAQWLESEDAQIAQRLLEEKIMQMLFSHDSTSPAFQAIAAQLAWIGSRPEKRPLLEKEIIALNFSDEPLIEQCSVWREIDKARHKVGKAGRAVGSFLSDHAAEIAVGVAICATGVGIAAATGYTLSAAIGGVVVAGAGSIFQSEEKPNPYIPLAPLPDPRACSQEELAAIQHGLQITLPKLDLPSSADEILVTADGIWAQGQFFSTDKLMRNSTFSSIFQNNTLETSLRFSVGFPGSDWRTFHSYFSEQQESNRNIPHQIRGENALALGHYNKAVHDLGKAIETNPSDPLPYLERGAAHFGLGEYDRSLADYQQFTSQTESPHPHSVSEFCLGFTKGLPKGTYESGEGLFLFLVDFAKHPIQTSKQAFDSITTLADLVRRDEWGAVAEALSPEMHQLVTQWDTLSSSQRGELAGYAVGKHGADILIPGALAKVASKSVKSAQELAAVCKNLQIAHETLILETAAGIGDSAKIAEVLEAGQKTAFFAEELGFAAREAGQLKQAGILETTVANHYDSLNISMQESIALHKRAQDILKPYSKKPMPEAKVRELIHETGMPTFSRPNGIPEDFLVMVADKGGGMEYVHPTNNHIRVRVMPGKPHSPNPSQQKPYVVQQKSGQAFDKHGNLILPEKTEAHIPLEEFVYRE